MTTIKMLNAGVERGTDWSASHEWSGTIVRLKCQGCSESMLWKPRFAEYADEVFAGIPSLVFRHAWMNCADG